MSTLNMPGFTAEAALLPTTRTYYQSFTKTTAQGMAVIEMAQLAQARQMRCCGSLPDSVAPVAPPVVLVEAASAVVSTGGRPAHALLGVAFLLNDSVGRNSVSVFRRMLSQKG